MKVFNLEISREIRIQFIKYITVGTLTLITDVFIYTSLIKFAGLEIILSAAISYVISLAVHFNLNRYWNFKNFDRRYHQQLGTYLIASGIFFTVNLLVIKFALIFGAHYLAAKGLAIIVLVCFSFLFNRYLTFGLGLRHNLRILLGRFSKWDRHCRLSLDKIQGLLYSQFRRK